MDPREDFEVTNFMCGDCRYRCEACQCIDHKQVHFSRPYFSCDPFTAHHTICSAFEPVDYYPALWFEWHYVLGGFERWHKLWLDQWHNGKPPRTVSLIRAGRPPEGREFGDDRWIVPYEDFVNCQIMKPDGIHYLDYVHIERTRKNPIGYEWIHEGPGILPYRTEGNNEVLIPQKD